MDTPKNLSCEECWDEFVEFTLPSLEHLPVKIMLALKGAFMAGMFCQMNSVGAAIMEFEGDPSAADIALILVTKTKEAAAALVSSTEEIERAAAGTAQ